MTKLVHENNYPQKIKSLVDELKFSKERMKELDEELKREIRVSTSVQYNNSILLEQNRAMKKSLMAKNPSKDRGNFEYVGDYNYKTGMREVKSNL